MIVSMLLWFVAERISLRDLARRGFRVGNRGEWLLSSFWLLLVFYMYDRICLSCTMTLDLTWLKMKISVNLSNAQIFGTVVKR